MMPYHEDEAAMSKVVGDTARAGLILAFAWAPLGAQFSELATTFDGGRAVFSSTLYLPGGKPNNWPKLFAATQSGVSLWAEREPAPPPQFSPYYNSVFYQLLSAEFSADGRLQVWNTYRPCTGGSGCINVERNMATVFGLVSTPERSFAGKLRISASGRYGVQWGSTAFYPTPRPWWLDLETGRTAEIGNGPPPSRGRVVADDGTALAMSAPGALEAVHPDRKTVPIAASVVAASIDRRARFVFYQTSTNVIRFRDLGSGFDFALLEDVLGCRQPVLSDDGVALLFLAAANWEDANPEGRTQAWLMDLGTGAMRQMTFDSTGIDSAVLSGDGRVVWSATVSGQLLRTDVASRLTSTVIGRTPVYEGTSLYSLAPGSQYVLHGRGFADAAFVPQPPYPTRLGGVELRINSVSLPLLYVSPVEIRFSVPWETSLGSATLALQSSQSPFLAALPYPIGVLPLAPHFFTFEDLGTAIAVHQDFHGVVSDDDRAQPGEIVHFYMTGLGPVTPATPADRPATQAARIQAQLGWTWYDDSYATSPADILYAGLAPGLTGIYQVSVRIPLSYSGARLRLSCETTGGYPSDMGAISVSAQRIEGRPLGVY
jgi:uncharacterized protein (TIGR03437 family)